MPTAKNRVALETDVDNLFTDGGELKTAEHRPFLKDLITSMVNVEDDIVPGAHSALRAYILGDVVTFQGRLLVCVTAHSAGAFNAVKWADPEHEPLSIREALTATATLDLASATVPGARCFGVTAAGSTQTVTAIVNAEEGWIYKLIPASGKTITFTHTNIGGLSAGEMCNKGGANLVLVGRGGETSDWVEYMYDVSTDSFYEINSSVYPT